MDVSNYNKRFRRILKRGGETGNRTGVNTRKILDSAGRNSLDGRARSLKYYLTLNNILCYIVYYLMSMYIYIVYIYT